MAAIKTAVKFNKNTFTCTHVIEESKEKMHVDSEDNLSFTVIYASQTQFNNARERFIKDGLCISYKELDNYIVNINDIKEALINNGLIGEEKCACCQ